MIYREVSTTRATMPSHTPFSIIWAPSSILLVNRQLKDEAEPIIYSIRNLEIAIFWGNTPPESLTELTTNLDSSDQVLADKMARVVRGSKKFYRLEEVVVRL